MHYDQDTVGILSNASYIVSLIKIKSKTGRVTGKLLYNNISSVFSIKIHKLEYIMYIWSKKTKIKTGFILLFIINDKLASVVGTIDAISLFACIEYTVITIAIRACYQFIFKRKCLSIIII